jgi:hypothetical protein
MTRTRQTIRKRNTPLWWVLLAIFVWYISPVVFVAHSPEERVEVGQ